jgi:hypothetical protein
MTQETIKALSDAELSQVVTWGQQEQQARQAQRKQETIAKIRQLAGAVGVSVSISGLRGRPPKGEKKGLP